jgi:hypothetical protein
MHHFDKLTSVGIYWFFVHILLCCGMKFSNRNFQFLEVPKFPIIFFKRHTYLLLTVLQTPKFFLNIKYGLNKISLNSEPCIHHHPLHFLLLHIHILLHFFRLLLHIHQVVVVHLRKKFYILN